MAPVPLRDVDHVSVENGSREVADVDSVDAAEVAEVVLSFQLLDRLAHQLGVVLSSQKVVAIHTT